MSVIDLPSDLVTLRAGDATFSVSLIAWARWYATYRQEGDDPHAVLDAARQKLEADCGVRLSDGFVDAFLHEVGKAHANLKKKQRDELSCLLSTDSTVSD